MATQGRIVGLRKALEGISQMLPGTHILLGAVSSAEKSWNKNLFPEQSSLPSPRADLPIFISLAFLVNIPTHPSLYTCFSF